MERRFRCIILISSAKKELELSEAEQMIASARKERAERDITSLVVFACSNILILLEGEPDPVAKEFREVHMHNGHHSIIKLFDQDVPHRFFDGYPLAFKSVSKDLKLLDDFTEREQQAYFDGFLALENPVSRIVSTFIKNNQ